MAYKSLYRTYRPQTFKDVAGQEAIITTLKHAIDEKKIAHAYLFCGPRGTGKTTVAKLLAKAVNCTGDPKPCGECENCKQIENGTHPDVIEIDAASNNGVEEVRSLIDKVKYAPTQGQYKVYIIDEVHMMSPGAFNALLKTLEEPPAHVIFILATTEPHKILPTIISRCQRFDFTRLTDQEMVQRMQYVLKEEGKTYDDGSLELIARLANGGMRDALSILEQCLAYNDDHLSINDIHTIYGIVSMDDKTNLLKVLLSKNMSESLKILDKMDKSGIDIKRLTFDLIDILKDIVVYRNTKDTSIMSVMTQKDLENIVPYISSDECFNFIDILMDASEKYIRATDPHIYFELALLRLCNQEHAASQKIEYTPIKEEPVKPVEVKKVEVKEEPIEEIMEEPVFEPIEEEIVETAIEKKEEQPVPQFNYEKKEEPETYASDDNIEVDQSDILNILVQADRKILNEVQEKWPVIRRYMANMNTAKAASMLSQGHPVAACRDGLIIEFELMPDVNAANYYKNYKQLSSLIKDVLGHEYKFIGMQHDAWLEMRQHYIQLARSKQLPQARPITLKHIDGYDLKRIDLNDAQKYALDMFGEDIVEFKED